MIIESIPIIGPPLKTLFPKRYRSCDKLTESSLFQMRAPFPLAGQAPGSNLASEESLMSISILFRTRAGDDLLIKSYIVMMMMVMMQKIIDCQLHIK